MIYSIITARRLGFASLLVCGMGLTGCTFDSAGNARWSKQPSDSQYAEPRTSQWNGHHGEPTVHRGGIGLRPKIDSNNLSVKHRK